MPRRKTNIYRKIVVSKQIEQTMAILKSLLISETFVWTDLGSEHGRVIISIWAGPVFG